jgi:hypothetical protein
MTDTDNHPFGGRDDMLQRVQTQLANAPHEPLVVIGRKSIGKTAFLHQVANTAPQQAVVVFMPLNDMPIDDETHFWVMMSQYILDTVQAYGFALPDIVMDEDAREWVTGQFFPAISKALRQRHLWILWDDAHHLLQENFSEGFLGTLRALCTSHVQMVFALDIAYEDMLGQLMPFITSKHQLRLGNLSLEACEAILHDYDDSLGNDMIEAIYGATGGVPHLIQAYGDELRQHADIKSMNNAVYTRIQSNFLAIWESATTDERLVLTAIADLFYDDPLRPIFTTTIATWSARSDYLLDETTINAALRGLLYDEIISMKANQIRINGELFRKWLLENARISADKSTEKPSIPISLIMGTVVVLGILFLIIILSLGGTPNSSGEIIPTVTLLP